MVPVALRGSVATAAAAVTTAYAGGGIVMSLGAQIAHDLIHSPNVFVNGAVLSLFAIVSGGTGLSARGLAPRPAMIGGAVLSILGAGLLALSVAEHSLFLFLSATSAVGAGYSLLFLGGLGLVNAVVPAPDRGATLSAVLLAAYLFVGLLALGLGRIATVRGLDVAGDLAAAAMAILSGLTILCVLTRVRRQPVAGVACPPP